MIVLTSAAAGAPKNAATSAIVFLPGVATSASGSVGGAGPASARSSAASSPAA
jgi:hypothetical protein